MTQPTRTEPTRTEPLLSGTRRMGVVRRLPAPACEPPYDLEPVDRPRTDAGETVAQGALALAFTLPSGLPAAPQEPPDLRLLTQAGRGGPRATDDPWSGPQLTPRAELPDPARWAGRLAQALLEVLAGQRPLAQLVRWTNGEVYDRLRRRAAIERAREPDPVRAVVRSITVTEPVDGVAEVAALVKRGARCTALAIRLEGIDGRWQCTAVELR